MVTSGVRDIAVIQAETELAFAVEVKPQLDVAKLRAALRGVLERHGELRATFRIVHGEVVVEFLPIDHFVLEFHDEIVDRERAVNDMKATMKQGLSVLTEPLIRMKAYNTKNTSIVFFMMHHIIADASSFDIMFRDLMALYFEVPSFVLPLPVPQCFTDYVDEEEIYLESEKGRQSASYWRKAMASMLPSVPFPYDWPKQGIHVMNSNAINFSFSDELRGKVGQLIQQTGCTPLIVALAAYATVIGNHAGVDAVPISLPAGRRNTRKRREMVGDLAQAIFVLARIGATLTETIGNVSREVVAATAHQEYPIFLVIDELAAAGHKITPAAGFLQFAFNSWTPQVNDPHALGSLYHNADDALIEIAGFTARTIALDRQKSSRHFRLNFSKVANELRFALIYNADLCREERMAGFIDDFKAVFR